MYKIVVFLLSFSLLAQSHAQVGIQSNTSGSVDGYTLFAPGTSDTTYLIDNCGRLINKWTSNYKVANSVHLSPDGFMWRACSINNNTFTIAGLGGRIEKYDWNGNLVWSYQYSNNQHCQHHDMTVLPNGNILLLAVEMKHQAACLTAGKDPALLPASGQLWPEMIVELQPVGSNGANVVWEWHFWDHLVQDYDLSKANYGQIVDHPELLNFNFPTTNPKEDWLHANGISYNADLDQIVLSCRIPDEIYIIDHSTTTAEAASHTGGNRGKGGDILYRWGNPEMYERGTAADRRLFGQHNPSWVPSGYPNAGKMSVFNNGVDRGYSSSDIFQPPVDSVGNYDLQVGAAYGPNSPDWSYADSANFYSNIISGTHALPNGNMMICEGKKGRFFEVDSNKQIVWEYYSPIGNQGVILQQGSISSSSSSFRAVRYLPDYPAFIGKNLTPGSTIEVNPNSCAIYTGMTTFLPNNNASIQLYPNPTSDFIHIEVEESTLHLEVFNSLGQSIFQKEINAQYDDCSTLDWENGLYWFKINNHSAKPVIVKH